MSVYAIYTVQYFVWLDILHILVCYYLNYVTQPEVVSKYFFCLENYFMLVFLGYCWKFLACINRKNPTKHTAI